MDYTTGENSTLADSLSRNPIEEASTQQNYDEEYVINTLSKLLKSNRKSSWLLNSDKKFLSTDQSKSMAVTKNPELTNEIALPKKFNRDVGSKYLGASEYNNINQLVRTIISLTKLTSLYIQI